MIIEKGDGPRYALLFPRRETGGHTSSSRVLCAETMGRSWSWVRRITNTRKMGAAIKRPHDTSSAASTIQDRWTGGQKVSQWVALAEYHNHHVICGNSGMCSKMWRLVHDVPRCMEPPRRCLWSPLELQTIHIGLTITEKALESTYKCFHI